MAVANRSGGAAEVEQRPVPDGTGPRGGSSAHFSAAATGISWRDRWQTFRLGAWLGWQIESNWADPLLFTIYSLVKPVAAAMILVVIYRIVGSETATALFPGMYVGNAFFMYVGALMYEASWVIFEDREYYQVLKYVYISSAGMFWYVAGRAVAKFFITTVAVLVLLVFGRYALGVSFAAVDWRLFAVVFPLGILTAVGFGFLLAGVMLLAARHGEAYAESVAGALYLLCGVVFPLDVLPSWLQAVGKAIPLTYWAEAMRRALLGEGFGQALARFSDSSLVSVLIVSTGLTLIGSVVFFAAMDRIARQRGLLDQLTEH